MLSTNVYVQPSTQDAPLIILALGFLTESENSTIPNDWGVPLKELASQLGYELMYIHWNAQSLKHNQVKSVKDKYKLLKGTIATWRTAVKEADSTAIALREVLRKNRHRKVILIGHSLGARIILKSAEFLAKDTIDTLIALAPAYDQIECKFEKVCRAVKTPPIICYSKNDYVLTEMFGVAQASQAINQGLTALKKRDKKSMFMSAASLVTARFISSPIGVLGVPKRYETHFRLIDKSPFSHFDYAKESLNIIRPLINQ